MDKNRVEGAHHMKTIKGVLILLAFFGMGTLANKWLHVPLPGNLLGMLLLTLALCTGLVKLEWVETASNLLIRHMMLFFVPILVGVTAYLKWIAGDPWPIVSSLVLGPLAVMLVSGRVVQWYLNRHKQKMEHHQLEGRMLDV
jgi:holin-like protein